MAVHAYVAAALAILGSSGVITSPTAHRMAACPALHCVVSDRLGRPIPCVMRLLASSLSTSGTLCVMSGYGNCVSWSCSGLRFFLLVLASEGFAGVVSSNEEGLRCVKFSWYRTLPRSSWLFERKGGPRSSSSLSASLSVGSGSEFVARVVDGEAAGCPGGGGGL